MAGTKEPVRCWTGEMSSLLAEAPAHVAKTCYEYDKTITSFFFTKKCIEQTKNFKLRSDDVFIITYPKTGTTWAQQIMMLVQVEADLSFFEGKHISKLVPFLEYPDLPDSGVYKTVAEINTAPTWVEAADAMPTDTPRILKTHVVQRWLPEGLKEDPQAKVVYVARNPKDTAVSYYHFCLLVTDLPNYTSWDEFFEEFIADRVPGGSWFDHTLSWWKLRNHSNVLFLTYEDMKQDSRKAVVRIAEFMGKSLSDDIIDRIVDASSFKFMKKNKSTNPDAAYENEMDNKNNKSFMRKGVVGDWKNHFSEDQNRRFDELYQEKMAGSGLELRFE
ncbi:sulfotransferase 1C2-like [Strongylocentrotus purpuratus]|uniref:Sulfotransferase domain-containing protein n=1 Tax=Strongylocentrotus purpuratus TaxID=7668 RepID=A0A7M7NI67_STRPU|nr:sulfotransferase 1C2-like [Strongylocentrotus purpuratus]